MNNSLENNIEDLILKNMKCVTDTDNNVYIPMSGAVELTSALLMTQVVLCSILKDKDEISLENEKYDEILKDFLDDKIYFEFNEQSNSLIFCKQKK